MKIAVFTPYRQDPLHPRLHALRQCLAAVGEVPKVHNLNHENLWRWRISWLTLGYFNLPATWEARHLLDGHEVVFVQDLSYLLICILAKRRGKRVIYETLDNNVHLRFFHLSTKWPWFRIFGWIRGGLAWLERSLAARFADIVIVNSPALREHFRGAARMIPYASPLESETPESVTDQSPAFLYLGWFCRMKGAETALDLIRRHQTPCYIIGSVTEPEVAERIEHEPLIRVLPLISAEGLRETIRELRRNHFLVGLSLTEPVNLSNSTQEINKDIDYLALGVPIVGNRRRPTAEKIEAGCGCFANQQVDVQRLLDERDQRERTAACCLAYYREHYAFEHYCRKVRETLEAIVRTS